MRHSFDWGITSNDVGSGPVGRDASESGHFLSIVAHIDYFYARLNYLILINTLLLSFDHILLLL